MSIKNTLKHIFSILTLLFTLLAVTSCESLDIVPNETDLFKDSMAAKGNRIIEGKSLGERLMGAFDQDSSINFTKSITYEVALKQFSVMPLVSVDRVGGTIVTDWYSTSSNLNERIKFNIFILDEKMQNESVNIIMFKETFNGSNWISSVANKKTSIQIKELILKKARQLKAASELS